MPARTHFPLSPYIGRKMLKRTVALGTLLAGATACIHAQWLSYPDPRTPRTRDGKPNLTAPAPRAPGGKPDLSGIWQGEGAPISELMKILPGGANGLGEDPPPLSFFNVLAGVKPEE